MTLEAELFRNVLFSSSNLRENKQHGYNNYNTIIIITSNSYDYGTSDKNANNDTLFEKRLLSDEQR